MGRPIVRLDDVIYGVCYLCTNAANGKRYVGQTISRYPWAYYREVHVGGAKKGSPKLFHNAIRKYGVNNFTFEMIYFALDREELDQAEDKFIVEYGCITPNGYNLKRGGARGKSSDSTKRKVSAAQVAIQSRPGFKEAHRAATIAAMVDPEVRERCAVMRGRRHITDGIDNKTITSPEEVPDGWRFGKTHKINRNIFITNGKSHRRITSDEPVPEGWEFGYRAHVGKYWITNGRENRRISNKEDKLLSGWYYGLTFKDPDKHRRLSMQNRKDYGN